MTLPIDRDGLIKTSGILDQVRNDVTEKANIEGYLAVEMPIGECDRQCLQVHLL